MFPWREEMKRIRIRHATWCALFSLAVAAAGGCSSTCECPGTYDGTALDIVGVPDGLVAGAAIAFSGDAGTAAATCQVDQVDDVTYCSWSNPGPQDIGSYSGSLKVSAPGYRSVEVPATITVAPYLPSGSDCDCRFASMIPSTVALEPDLDGGG